MLKKITLVAAFVAALFVAGCKTTEGVGDESAAGNIGAVVEGVKNVCSFAPSVTSIAALVGITGASTVDQVVNMVCDQVAKKAAKVVDGQVCYFVKGVCVTGTRVE